MLTCDDAAFLAAQVSEMQLRAAVAFFMMLIVLVGLLVEGDKNRNGAKPNLTHHD